MGMMAMQNKKICIDWLRHNASVFIWPFFLIIVATYFNEVRHDLGIWKTADWLISYQAGWLRRGLMGSILSVISDLGLPLKWVVFTVQVVLFFLIFHLVQKIYDMCDRKSEWWLFLYSPAFLLFPFYDLGGGFRKEILAFLSFLVLSFTLTSKDFIRRKILLSLALYTVAAFSHELVSFTWPFFAYILFRGYQKNRFNQIYFFVSLLLFGVAAFSALLFAQIFTGGVGFSNKMCTSAISHGFSSSICSGAINWLRFDAYYGMTQVINYLPTYLEIYLPLSFLAVLPLFFSDWMNKSKAIFLLISFTVFLPLYFIAVDWGRWIYIYIFFVFTIILVESVNENIVIRRLPPWLMVLYLGCWSIPTCCYYRMGFGIAQKLYKSANWLLN